MYRLVMSMSDNMHKVLGTQISSTGSVLFFLRLFRWLFIYPMRLAASARIIMLCASLSVNRGSLQGKDTAFHVSAALGPERDVHTSPSSVPGVVSEAQINKCTKCARRQDEGSPSHSLVGTGSPDNFQYGRSQKETGWSPAGGLLRRTRMSAWVQKYPYQ